MNDEDPFKLGYDTRPRTWYQELDPEDTEFQPENRDEEAIEELIPTGDKEEFIRRGEWIYSFEDALYQDVLTAAWLEGYFVRQIEHKEDGRIHIKIQEEQQTQER